MARGGVQTVRPVLSALTHSRTQKHHRSSAEMISHPPQVSQTECEAQQGRKGQSQPPGTAPHMGMFQVGSVNDTNQPTKAPAKALAFPYPPSSTTKHTVLILKRGDCISHNPIPDVFCPVSAEQKLLVRINKLSELSSGQYFIKFSLVSSTVHRVKPGEVGHTERVNLSTEASFLEGCSSVSP